MVDRIVVLAGGSGTRLWPLSSLRHPKQFCDVGTGKTLIQLTLARLRKYKHIPILIVAHKRYTELLTQQIKDVPLLSITILEEPESKNTAAAIALAVAYIMREDKEASILVISSDHLIYPTDLFIETVEQADGFSRTGALVTMGIVPHRPDTGYGYIKKGALLTQGVWQISEFMEKPDQRTADHYYGSKNYFWNSGMFVFYASVMLREFEQHIPYLATLVRKIRETRNFDEDLVLLYRNLKAISIDYAVMEKSKRGVVVKAAFQWSDVGNWDELFRLAQEGIIADKEKDVYKLDTTSVYTKNSDRVLVHSEVPVALIGVSDTIVVLKNGKLLVMKRGSGQEVKDIVDFFNKDYR